MRVIARVLTGVALLAFAGSAYQSIASALDRRRFPPPGRLVDVGGHRLHINCAGEGGPTVIIEAAGGGASTEWDHVQAAVARSCTVCVYDRAGYGWSDPGPLPRTTQQVVDELRVLLERAEVERPVVLVGHSLGGVNVRRYARTYPDDVAGLVLVDSSHERQLERLPWEAGPRGLARQVRALRVGQLLVRLGIVRIALRLGFGKRLPGFAALSRQGLAVAMRTSVVDSLHSELSNVGTSLAQAGVLAQDLGSLPIVVLSRGRSPFEGNANQPVAEIEQGWRELQNELAGLSSVSRHVIAEKSSHYIHEDEPDLVVDAVRWVVERVREG